MVTRQEALHQMRREGGPQAAGRRLGLPAGKVYMIATGLPADGSDSLAPEDYGREGLILGGAQRLLGVPGENPNRPEDKPEVLQWVRARAHGDAQMQAAGRLDERES